MKVFILRHGMTGESKTDAERQLTSAGRSEVVKVVRSKIDDLSNVDRVYSSAMIRVRDTLDIANNLIGFEGEVQVDSNLMTGSRLNEIIAFAESIDTTAGDILVSSHQSCTSILVLWLTGEDILIPNGSLLAIEADELAQGKGKILWQESASGDQIKHASSFADFV